MLVRAREVRVCMLPVCTEAVHWPLLEMLLFKNSTVRCYRILASLVSFFLVKNAGIRMPLLGFQLYLAHGYFEIPVEIFRSTLRPGRKNRCVVF